MIKTLLTTLSLFFTLCLLGQDFTSIWNTNNIESGSSANNQVTIPTNPAYTNYNYTIDWGDTSTDTGVTGNITHDYGAPGTYTIKISGTFPSIYFNDEQANDKLKIIEILSWGTIQWQTMENAFYGCENLNFDAIDSPDLSQVTTLKQMFRGCSSFNGIVNDWDVSTITDISGMFYSNSSFNRPLDLWVTSSITDMSQTFYSASRYNEPLDNWNTGAVTNMMGMFDNAGDFNQNINNWNVSQVTNMSFTFSDTNDFNMPLNNWDVSKVTDMSYMFDDSGFNQPIGNWDVSKVTNMSHMFSNAVFNQPIGDWIVSLVEDMSFMFQRHWTFNQPLNNWDTSKVTNMESMFDGYYWDNVYNYPLDNWDVSAVTNMKNMFRDNSSFNQPIGNWLVTNVTNMEGMFSLTDAFNQNISGWNISNVTNIGSMFQQASVFNQPLNSWNVANVTNVTGIFYRATAFNQPLNSWNLLSATNFTNMFNLATSFNEDITGWDTSIVTNMSGMFSAATSFNQNIGVWNISSVTNMSNIFSNSGISQENYDNILIAWSGQTVNSGINLGATNLQYCDALTQRQSLIDDDGWNITGDAVNCSYVLCTEITMPHSSDTATPANSDIRWNPAPNATGYRVTIEVERGGVRSYVTINGSTANNYDVGNVVGVSFTNEFMANDMVFVTVVPYNGEGPATGCQEINFTVVESWVNSLDAFKLTYDTTLQEGTTTTPINQLIIQTQSGFTYDYNIDWGDGQYDNNVTGAITHTYLNPGIYTVSIIGTFPSPRHNQSSGDAYKLLSIDQWGTQAWESMNNAFAGCENMEYNATDVPNLTNVTDMTSMFIVCDKFNGNINNWDVSNVTGMYGVFGSADIFNQPLNNWDVSNVTNMNFMFASTDEFNQDISSWNVGNVIDMARMFQQAESFNQPLNSWNVSNVIDMSQLFYSAEVFDQPLNLWNVEKVEEMDQMFYSAEVFNQDIDSWDVSSVTTMSQMFYSAIAFNEPLNSWDVSSVTTMASMFYNAEAFNQPLDSWNVNSVSTMSSMFSSTDSFNQNIDSWNVTNVTNMTSMFSYALSFDQPLNSWDVNSVVNMSSMFRGAAVFNQPLGNWNVSAVATMNNMFEDALLFNQPINTWNVSSVTLMESMFEDAAVFNQPLNNWNTAVVTNFEAMFKNALAFNEPLTSWNTGEALNMEEMFSGATAFNQNIDAWNVSFVTTMEAMFNGATAYNQAMNSWNVASVATMEDMFKGATAFNENISDWNVRGVTTMEEMFSDATAFNQVLNNWRISGVNNMDYMFRNASAYNQPMDLWNPGNVTMRSMFDNATSLNQSLAEWDVSNVTNMSDMLDHTALIRENYDNTLIAWSEQTLTSGITLGAEGLPYCDAQEERQSMIDTYGWTFSQDVRDCPIPECTQLASPLDGDTDVPVNTNITWDAALFAQGYRLTVGTSAGGNDIVDNETITNETSFEFTSDFNTGDTVYVTIIPFNDEGDAVGPCTEENFTISNDPATIPDCTNLTEPLNNANDVLVTSDLSWNPISNADGYKLIVGTSSGASDILNSEDVGNINTYEFTSDLPEDSDIFVTIIPYNDEGDAVSCTEESFHTELIPVPPVCTNLTSPINGATDVAIDTHLSWTPIANANGYLVLVGTTSGGIEIVNNVDVVGANTYDIPVDLQEGRLHYVTIIPYNDEGDATGCTEETFTTGDSTSPPSCTTLTAPINGATAVDPSTNLTWAELSSATGYNLTVGTTSGGSDIFTGDVLNVTTYDLATDLPESSPIYITVTPYNDNGDAIGCMEETFTTDGAPLCTSLITPANNATDIAVDTSIEWNASSNTDGYKLTVTASSSTANNLTDFDVTTGTTYDFANDFERGETVTVTIVPYNSIGNAVGPCTSESFTIIPPPVPVCTTLISPTDNATNIAVDSDLEWNASTGADGYKLTIVASTSTINNVTDLDITTGTTYSFSNDFTQGETVSVTLVPYNDQGDAIGCTAESFTIKPVPGCTSLIDPSNGAVDVAVDTNISWTAVSDATGYKLTVSASSSTVNNTTDELITSGNSYNFSNDFEQGETVTVTITPYNEVGDAIGCTSESFTIKPVPVCTILTAPANEDINIPVDTNITWNTITDATGYKVTVSATTSTANNGTFDVTTGNSYNFSNDFEQGENVTVTIVPYNEVGDAIGCTAESFTIKPIPLCTNLSLPENGDIDVPVDTGITWNEISDANGYHVTISASSSTANNGIFDVTTGNSYDFPNDFEQSETVTVTIVPYNEVGNAIGCTSESFTIKSVPLCTNLIAPADGDIVAEVDEISWNAVTDANGYKLTISATNTTSNNVTDLEVTGTSYIFPNDFNQGEMVTITITPYNEVGDAIGCTSESFTIRPIPPCTDLVASLNDAREVSVMADISWNSSFDADGYRISVGTSLNGTDIVNNEDVASLTSYTFAENLPSETLIYVTITPYNTSGDAVGCTSNSFETEVIIPECTVLSSPFNGETEVDLEASIIWQEVEKTDGYRLSIGTSAGGTDIVNNEDMGSNTSYSPVQEYPFGTEIFVTITPYNSKGDAIQCEQQSFTTLVPEDETKYGFSPDGDGINEYWHIDNIEYYPENVVSIYNRWGDMVFEIKNYDNNSAVFTGEANLKTKMGAGQLPDGTYFFNIQIEGETILQKTKGYVIIKR
ncbi:BspA family leucine-rich repeat surface protein [uncultured Maribacter sp.]|uniref:BspA family leucine-rich repeat surface protein n=1 Tax=uncultured Maribacter sp. TaxID=431308 RepID=UPI002632BC80|nr:BspA family leucine-rich repeat surface protein [uncultured Maribacter sp.]